MDDLILEVQLKPPAGSAIKYDGTIEQGEQIITWYMVNRVQSVERPMDPSSNQIRRAYLGPEDGWVNQVLLVHDNLVLGKGDWLVLQNDPLNPNESPRFLKLYNKKFQECYIVNTKVVD